VLPSTPADDIEFDPSVLDEGDLPATPVNIPAGD